MNDVVIASNEADATAQAAVEEHHAQLAGMLAAHVQALVDAASDGDRVAAAGARIDLVAWAQRELVPHALAEERSMYPAAGRLAAGRLLIEGMLAEHRVIVGLVGEAAATSDPVRAAAAARALQVLFESHLAKENELVLPLLAAAPEVSLSGLLAGMHELLGGHPDAPSQAVADGNGHSCSCGDDDGPGYPELDARTIPHAVRHAAIFGALDAVRAGGGLVLLAAHDPLPLLAQIRQRSPGVFEISYLERGPQTWRLALVRGAA